MRAGLALRSFGLVLALGFPFPTRAQKLELPTADKAVDLLGFTGTEKKQLLAGQTVAHELGERADELAILLARTIPRPMDKLADELRSGKLIKAGQDVLAMGEIDVKRPLPDSLRAATFGSDEEKEIDGLLAVQPGARFNLSADEIARFAKLRKELGTDRCKGDPKCTGAVMAEYQDVLAGRMRDYLNGGLASLAPYARENGKISSPGDALRASLDQARLLEERFPAVFRNLKAYPAATGDAEDHYFWIKMKIQDRPTFILSHRRLYVGSGGGIEVESQFYVGQSYNALQILAGGVPEGEGTLIFYTNHTFTDQVAGVAQSMRHSIGRKLMKKAILDHLDAIAAAR